MKKISILIVDDHKLVREAWEKMLSYNESFEVIYSAPSAEKALEFLIGSQPDIILLDINMQGMSGIDAIEHIISSSPQSGIIGVSSYTLPVFVKSMLNRGARGYITKNSPQEELFQAIQMVHAGQKFICSEIINAFTSQFTQEAEGNAEIKHSITKRELEIIHFIKKGMTSREIGGQLGVAPKTVEVHRYNILRKLQLKNVAELVAFAHNKLGFI